MAKNNSSGRRRYIYDLPASVREKLCQVSDQTKTWRDLAKKHKKYTHDAIAKLGNAASPTDDLLTEWGYSNLTIIDLFKLLSQVQDLESMNILKPFVDRQDRALLAEMEDDILIRLCPNVGASNSKDIDSQNFNHRQPAHSDSPKVIVLQNDIKSPERKMINVPPSPDVNLLPSQNGKTFFQSTASTSKINNESPLLSGDNVLLEIAYNRLEKITENWSTYNILGQGSFGTVFTARLNQAKWKGTAVALRKIENLEGHGFESFSNLLQDLKFLNSYEHHNILTLFAYGLGSEALCLVHELMTKGSLEEKLFNEKGKPLSWLQRRVIAKGIARGLHYLHTLRDEPLVHGNIKSSNILLDKNLEPRIGDVGLARICQEKEDARVSRMRQRRPYLPQEFLESNNLSPKMDVYCFGLVLFELATGRLEYDDARPTDKYLKKFIEDLKPEHISFLRDIRLEPETENIFENLISIGKWCTKGIPRNLPAMFEVLLKVNKL